MQALDHAAGERDDAEAGVVRRGECLDHLPRPGDLFLGVGREGLVGDRHLARVDQRLAVHAQVAALLAFGAEALAIVEVVEGAVEDGEAVGAGGEHALRQMRQQRGAAGR